MGGGRLTGGQRGFVALRPTAQLKSGQARQYINIGLYIYLYIHIYTWEGVVSLVVTVDSLPYDPRHNSKVDRCVCIYMQINMCVCVYICI